MKKVSVITVNYNNADGLKKQAGLFSRKPLAVADLRKILTW